MLLMAARMVQGDVLEIATPHLSIFGEEDGAHEQPTDTLILLCTLAGTILLSLRASEHLSNLQAKLQTLMPGLLAIRTEPDGGHTSSGADPPLGDLLLRLESEKDVERDAQSSRRASELAEKSQELSSARSKKLLSWIRPSKYHLAVSRAQEEVRRVETALASAKRWRELVRVPLHLAFDASRAPSQPPDSSQADDSQYYLVRASSSLPAAFDLDLADVDASPVFETFQRSSEELTAADVLKAAELTMGVPAESMRLVGASESSRARLDALLLKRHDGSIDTVCVRPPRAGHVLHSETRLSVRGSSVFELQQTLDGDHYVTIGALYWSSYRRHGGLFM